MSHKDNRSKRSRQDTGKGNSNRPRSKHNPKGKRKDPPVDWPKYNKRCGAEGKNRKARFGRLAGEACRLLGVYRRVKVRDHSSGKPGIGHLI